MRIEGVRNDDIARELKVTKRTLAVWFSDDLVKEYLQDLAVNVETAFAERLATAGMVAVTELTRLLQKDDAEETISNHQKLEVARELMDRLPGTARNSDRNRPQSDGNGGGGDTNQTAIFANMSDEQLAGFLTGGWAGQLNGHSSD